VANQTKTSIKNVGRPQKTGSRFLQPSAIGIERRGFGSRTGSILSSQPNNNVRHDLTTQDNKADADSHESETNMSSKATHLSAFSKISLLPELEDRVYAEIRNSYFSGDKSKATNLVTETLNSGCPLVSGICSEAGRHYAKNFSSVRIHTDTAASIAANALDANAFTIGNNIVFAKGQHDFHSSKGKNLLAHELAHVIQQTGSGTKAQGVMETQATTASVLGAPYSNMMHRVSPIIMREPTRPRRATQDQMISEATRVLSLTRDTQSTNEAERMWSNVANNFLTITTGSIARRIWTHILLRHFTEANSGPDTESVHPRYIYSHQYGWIDAQHFFGFIDFAEQQWRRHSGNNQQAFDAATQQGANIERDQQRIRDYVVLQQEPARNPTLRLMQIRPPNTSLFRTPVAVAGQLAFQSARLAAELMLGGTQRQLYQQLNRQQQAKFFGDSAKSAFTYEDFVSNQLGTRFFFQHGITINQAEEGDREALFMSSLSSFFSSIQVENSQQEVDRRAQYLPDIETFEAPKTTEERERRDHPELFELP